MSGDEWPFMAICGNLWQLVALACASVTLDSADEGGNQ